MLAGCSKPLRGASARQAWVLWEHFTNAPGMHWLALVVVRGGNALPSEETLKRGIRAAAIADVARGVRTLHLRGM